MIRLCWQVPFHLPYTPNKTSLKILPLLNAPFSLLCLVLFPIGTLPAKQDFPEPFVEILEGWTIEFGQEFLDSKHKKLFQQTKKALANHLQRIIFLLPQEKHQELQKLVIRVDYQHELSNMQYHPSQGWLEKNGYDPSLEKRVHVPRARQLLERSTWLKHPYVILHELAHSYHDQVLNFENEEIKLAYQRAEKEKLYERVLLFRGGMTRHYARTNHKEFFAEMTESYVGVNDFFPFVRAELKQHDPKTFTLMEKIWGKF